MEKLVFGLWGCFFGLCFLGLLAAVVAMRRSLRSLAITASIASLTPAVFALTFLGWAAFDSAEAQLRLQATVAAFASAILTNLLLTVPGVMKSLRRWRGLIAGLNVVLMGFLVIGWLLPAKEALLLGIGVAYFLGFCALAVCSYIAWHGSRLGKYLFFCVFLVLVSITGWVVVALSPAEVFWGVHVMASLAGSVYLLLVAYVLWALYANLKELRRISALDGEYDALTQLPSQAATGQMVGAEFKYFQSSCRSVSVIALNLSNLKLLESLHGADVANLVLFVLAGRLRRAVGFEAKVGRPGRDWFLLVLRNAGNNNALLSLARSLQSALTKPVSLNVVDDANGHRKSGTARMWGAELGLGVLTVFDTAIQAQTAIQLAHSMSKAALAFPSRIAWFDYRTEEIMDIDLVLNPSWKRAA